MCYGVEEGNFDVVIVNDAVENAYNDLKAFVAKYVEM